jgi:microfibrillar-associated protein 1
MLGAYVGRTGDAPDANKGRVETTKVKRYRPGQQPEWMKTGEEEFELAEAVGQATLEAHATGTMYGCVGTALCASLEPRVVPYTGVAAPVIVKKADDPRLRRLAERGPVDRGAARDRHREVAAPQIVRRRERPSEDQVTEEAVGDREALTREQDDEDAIAARREKLRQR